MKKNMGSFDKIARILLGILFGILYFTDTVTGTFGIVLLILGIIFVLTSLVGFCPLYSPMKMSTLKEDKSKK
ncbi:MAG: DUF2892 domain-containing protein [Ignavibacteriales bacterium]|nr:DUF2892 domain-containing protein [Ignavibacteriales bacterium]